jgi:hypothetical protein
MLNVKTLTMVENKLPNTTQLRLNVVHQKLTRWTMID